MLHTHRRLFKHIVLRTLITHHSYPIYYDVVLHHNKSILTQLNNLDRNVDNEICHDNNSSHWSKTCIYHEFEIRSRSCVF